MIKVHEILDLEEMKRCFPLIKQLNPGLTKKKYDSMLDDMVHSGYRMVGVRLAEKYVAVSGFWIATKIYSGKYLEIDNLVVDQSIRNRGIGKKICSYLVGVAQKSGCETVMLDAYAENSPAHRFYYREGFFVRGFHFIKKL